MKAIITDAGFASRYLPITKTIPKAMIPIGSKPVMQLCVEECAEAGIDEIIIVTTPNTMGKQIYDDYFHNPTESVKALLDKQGKSERFESVEKVLNFPKITIIEQDASLPYSDDLILGEGDVKTLIEEYQTHPGAKGVITTQEMPEEVWHKYGMVALKDNGTLSHIVEKPKTPDLSPSNLTSYGRYLLTPEVFDYLIPSNTGLDGELWTVDAITKLAEHGDVVVAKSRGKWITTGDPKNYFMAHLQYVMEHTDYAEDVRKFVEGDIIK